MTPYARSFRKKGFYRVSGVFLLYHPTWGEDPLIYDTTNPDWPLSFPATAHTTDQLVYAGFTVLESDEEAYVFWQQDREIFDPCYDWSGQGKVSNNEPRRETT